MSHTKIENISKIRGALPMWARTVLDTLLFLMQDEAIAEVFRQYDPGQLKNVIGGTMVRVDPYKAPEQMDIYIHMIKEFLYKELHK